MKRLLVVMLSLMLAISAFSQKIYCVYLESEGGLQFSLKLDKKIYHSSSKGYVIIPRLKDSTYNFTIILQGDQAMEQRFTIPIKGKDHGYLIRNFGEKGWGLYDLQTSSVQMSQPDPSKAGVRYEKREVSRFTQILALAARDPSLLEREIVIQQAVVKEVVPPPQKQPPVSETETPKTLTAESTAGEIKTEEKQQVIGAASIVNIEGATAKQETANRDVLKPEAETVKEIEKPKEEEKKQVTEEKPVVKKETEIKQAEEKKKEPIKDEVVEVPQKKEEPLKPENKKENTEPEKEEIKKEEVGKGEEVIAKKKDKVKKTVENDIPKDEGRGVKEEIVYKKSIVTRRSESSTTEGFGLTFTDQYADGSVDTIKIIIPNPKYRLTVNTPQQKDDKKFLEITSEKPAEGEPEVAVKKNKCRETATENDVARLRKKMTSEKSDEGRVDEARKVFRYKCYTVEQVRSLADLFQDDGGRYRFFDESYQHVSDLENFTTLEKELKDQYYLTRFRAIVQ